MNKSSENILEKDWFYDRYLAREVESRRYFILSCCLTIILALFSIILFFLFPLKRTVMEPYVLLIDDINGITSTLTAAKSINLDEHVPIVRYFLAKYLQARENVNPATIETQFELVRAFSTPEIYSIFENEWNEKQLTGQNTGGGTNEITTEILSITFPSNDIAHIRYNMDERKNGISENKTTWLATLKLKQVQEIDDNLAILNPLGMVIINYKTQKENHYANN